MSTTTPAAQGRSALDTRACVALRAARGGADRGRTPRARALDPGRVQQHTRGLVGALNADWRRIAADPSARATVAGWASTVPAFAGCADPGAVVDAVTRGGRDEVLLALLRLARDGEALAARIALQVMLGSAVRLARRTLAHAQGDLEESLSRAVTALWQVVRDYPVERRTCRPADGISLDVLAALTAAGRSRPAEVPGGLAAELADIPRRRARDVGREACSGPRLIPGPPGRARTNSSSSYLPGVSAVPSCRSRTLACCSACIRPANPAPRCRAGRWPTNSASVTPPCGSGPPGRPGAWRAPSRTRPFRSSLRQSSGLTKAAMTLVDDSSRGCAFCAQ